MKKSILLVIILFSICLGADTISYQLDFEMPVLEPIHGYTTIRYDNCQILGEAGSPSLPRQGIKLLLAPGQEAIAVNVTNVIYYAKRQYLRLAPIQQSVPISEIGSIAPYTVENEIYLQSTVYPERPVTQPVTHFKNGHSIALLTCSPVLYYPAIDSVQFIQSIDLEIITENSERAETASIYYKQNSEIIESISHIVDNPENLQLYPESISRSERKEILIITAELFSSAFSEYITYKETCGFRSLLITTEQIIDEYEGSDEQEKIRNAIIDAYQEHDIQYVILAGDSSPEHPERDIIPHRGFYGSIGGYVDYDIPSDLYYSCLDGDWNADGDEMWGEYEEADYFEEVAIGRICGSTITEISNHLHKLYMYEHEPVTGSIEHCLFIGQEMDDILYGGEYLEEIATGCDNWGFYTAGISDNIAITRLYEMYFPWEAEDLFNNLNSGTNLVNNMGHGATETCFNLHVDEINTTNLNNNGVDQGYYNCYSQACYAGAFDDRKTNPNLYVEECFAEKLTNLETGAVSFIANSRYSWYRPGNTNGVSQYYARQFYDAIFGEGINRIGLANADAREANAAFLEESRTHRWTYCSLNLLGDPSMILWTAIPQAIAIDLPNHLWVGDKQIPFQSESSNLRYAVFMSAEMLGWGHTGKITNQPMLLENPLCEAGVLDIYINQANHWQYVTQIEVLPVEQEILLQSIAVNDALGWNVNGLADYGETVSLDLNVHNPGTESVDNLELHLDFQDEYISVKDSILYIGEILSGETQTQNEVFNLTLAENIPDQHTIELVIYIMNDSVMIRECPYDLICNAPLLEMGEMRVIDGDNGILDVGETIELGIQVQNSGNSLANDLSLELFCTTPEIRIYNSQLDLAVLLPHSEVTGLFQVAAASELPVGELIEFIVIAQAEAYNFCETIPYYTGVQIEDFETGDLSMFDWITNNLSEWEISENAREGEYSVCSPLMDNYSRSGLTLNMTTLEDGYIRFWAKTRGLPYSGFFSFHVDNDQKVFWVNQTDWSWLEIFIPAGEHEFFWKYSTGMSGGDYHSRAWVDYIVFPLTESVEITSGTISDEFAVSNYPNPFNPSTIISYTLQQPAEVVELSVYNIKGQKIWSYNELNVSSGRQEIYWDGRNIDREPVASGIYFYQLTTPGQTINRKMMLMK
jgi:Peptidase family C25/FlgD Ig-like domain/Propeptide_C25